MVFSNLPHKELRFIIYVFPLLNVSAAAACHRIWENRAKTTWNYFLAIAIMFHLVLNAIFSMFLLSVASSNYPGGQAIARLHRLEKDSIEPVHVHIDVLTAQTGVSRFMQTNGSWIYSKQENLTIDDPDMLQFTHLLMEGRSKHSSNVKLYLKTHDIIDSIQGFSHISLNYNMVPPIKIKTKPTIFILKRKSYIKYDSNKAKSWIPVKDFVNQIHDIENRKLNTSFKEEIVNELVKSEEEFEKAKETIEQNYSDIELEETKKENDTMKEKVEIFEDLSQLEDKSMENAATWETESINKLSLNSRDENKENINFQENFECVSDNNDVKSNEVKVEKEDIKGKSKNDIKVGPESHGVKETVKKMIQEKLLEAKQRRELNDERKNTELPIKPMKKRGVAADLLKRIEVLKQELKESTIFTDKSATMQKESKITKDYVKDDKLTKQKLVTQKKDKIKIVKSSDLEQSEDTVEKENEIVDVKVDAKKIAKSQDKVDSELLPIEAEIAEEEDKEENVKISKSVNVRESIKNIINQFKEFEEDFIRDDTDITSDMNNADRIESVKNDGQVMVKDARESLKEILDQFKYIKHELTEEEDDQFDEIAAKYMERPIAETLLQFNEALKALIQRRKNTSSKVLAANLHEEDTHISENKEKSVAEESDENSDNVNTSNEESSQKNIKSRNKL